MTPFPDIAFINEEIHLLVLFHVLLFQLIDLSFLVTFISLFEINKVNPFSALTTPFPLIFLSNLANIDEAVLVANLAQTSSAKGAPKVY